MTTRRQRRHSAFTLVELLVVIGVIGILLGGIGLALGRGDKSTALQAGQNTLASLLGAVRAHAALAHANAMLAVDVDPASDGFLRRFYVVVNTGTTPSEKWTPVGSPTSLPTGVHLVPKNTGMTYNHAVVFDSTWTADVSSTSFEAATVQLENITGTFAKVVTITPIGSTNNNGQLVLSPTETTDANTIQFNNPNHVRGALVSKYGVLTFINEADAFKE